MASVPRKSFIPTVRGTLRSEYEIYTTEFDKVVTGVEWMLPETRRKLGALGTVTTARHNNTALRDEAIAEILINGNRHVELLPYIIAEPEAINVTNDTAISILFDMSGSARGAPAVRSYALADAFMRHAAFNTSNTNIELNAFTTCAWKGGRSRQAWLQDGKPNRPGRLNDLLAIKLSEFNQEVTEETYNNLAVFLSDECTRENIDGESILWAAERLAQQPQSNKVLLIVSDDAPTDDSTLSANSNDYLGDHLDKVCSEINAAGIIKLVHLDHSDAVSVNGYKYSKSSHRGYDKPLVRQREHSGIIYTKR